LFFLKEFIKIIQIDADYFTSWVLLFVLTSHSFCVFELTLYSLTTVVCPIWHPFDYRYSIFTSVVSGSISFRLSLLHFHYYGVCVRFDTLWIIITSLSLLRCVYVRFDTLSIIITSLLVWCVSGSTPFRLSLFHFYYGLCRVQHPFDYHYFTFTMVCVGFNTLSIVISSLFTMVCVGFNTLSTIIISLLLGCVSGSTPFQLSLFHFY